MSTIHTRILTLLAAVSFGSTALANTVESQLESLEKKYTLLSLELQVSKQKIKKLEEQGDVIQIKALDKNRPIEIDNVNEDIVSFENLEIGSLYLLQTSAACHTMRGNENVSLQVIDLNTGAVLSVLVGKNSNEFGFITLEGSTVFTATTDRIAVRVAGLDAGSVIYGPESAGGLTRGILTKLGSSVVAE